MNASDANAFKLVPDPDPDDQSSYAERQIIGYVGMLLPPVLWLVTATRPITPTTPRWEPLHSISAYYYSGAVAIFAGGMFAMAVFLFGYHGYKNEFGLRDRVAALVAAIAAIVAACVPTNAYGDFTAPVWWQAPMKNIHFIAGACLFTAFIYFALFQFPISQAGTGALAPDKIIRNRIYRLCGLAIAGCLVWAAVIMVQNENASIFWPETIALEVFAATWLLKGRADMTVVAVKNYALHPGRLASDVRGGVSRYVAERTRPAQP